MVEISKVMKTDVIAADPEATIEVIARIMSNNQLGSVVIKDFDSDEPKGIITWSSIITMIGRGQDVRQTKAKNVISKNLITADHKDDITSVTKKMVKHNIDRVPVTRDGKLVGIVSYKDLLATTPELIEILSEKLRVTASRPPRFGDLIPGACESCGNFSNRLQQDNGRWICEECAD